MGKVDSIIGLLISTANVSTLAIANSQHVNTGHCEYVNGNIWNLEGVKLSIYTSMIKQTTIVSILAIVNSQHLNTGHADMKMKICEIWSS